MFSAKLLPDPEEAETDKYKDDETSWNCRDSHSRSYTK
jgi:hypothetical protein